MARKKSARRTSPPIAFIVMAFDGRLEHVYQRVAKPVLEHYHFECRRGDEIREIGIIMEQIEVAIQEADLVVCDLTYENPNVFYELGIADVLKKPTILMSQSAANLPFDVQHRRVIPYEDNKLGLLSLRDTLEKYLVEIFPMDETSFTHRPPRDFPLALDELEVQRAALFSNSLDVKRFAIKFLGDYRDKASYHKIQMMTGDPNPDVKRDAFTALHKIDPDKVRPLLLDAGLRHQYEFLVRERVVLLLGSYPPDDDLMDQMIHQLGDSSWGVRRTVCEVLGRWGKRETIGPLQQMLVDSEPQVRLAAAEALERLGMIEAVEEAAEAPAEQ